MIQTVCWICSSPTSATKYCSETCQEHDHWYHHGLSDGAAVAFGLMGMAEAIRERRPPIVGWHLAGWAQDQWNQAAAYGRELDGIDEDPGVCGLCEKPMELVRPGKSQPTCDCWNEEKRGVL